MEVLSMDKNLDWKLICFKITKTTNAAFLLKNKERKRQPAVIDNTLGVVISSQTFRYCRFVKIFKSKRMVEQHAKRVFYLTVRIIVPVL